jgi:hypothetical protein
LGRLHDSTIFEADYGSLSHPLHLCNRQHTPETREKWLYLHFQGQGSPGFAEIVVCIAKIPIGEDIMEDCGFVYMVFGKKALIDFKNSVISLRRSGCNLPVIAVGDIHVQFSFGKSITSIKWEGEDPYDKDARKNFQFKAGRVKPFLYQYTPFKKNMYLDTDTVIMKDPSIAFNYLNNWDAVFTEERLMVCELYNKVGAGWEHHLAERDQTVKEFGGDGHFKFWNSGVFLWNQNLRTETLFNNWHQEWLRWQRWDEQLALMRAANRSPVRIFILSEIWNCPHQREAKLIWHNYGRGTSRVNVNMEVNDAVLGAA